MPEKIFYFDGNCEFCTSLSQKLKSVCLDPAIQFESFQKYSNEELRKMNPSLDRRVAQGNVQLLWEGRRYPGFFAVRKLSHSLRGWRWISPLLYLPLVPFFGILAMNLLKAVRSGKPE
ncbi:hypothetical protein CH373_04170 [Leptospira perolatii]|uniref:Thiol-disulfide oxidoreductase n=1 Tax=Leptospira perolatii TaxID=2023191 RepID=A0A2M9ZQ25_9LEPT|nr:DCC1-like thiol-disulfide oxidoreductase family protein [Leptospira perolatii]PJZ69006.1 hypothetical protein CH360_13160 [Leptospira perolatii]PJZ74125.1 hypothetical protein CH373_04170 [Leptospira perolatii]